MILQKILNIPTSTFNEIAIQPLFLHNSHQGGVSLPKKTLLNKISNAKYYEHFTFTIDIKRCRGNVGLISSGSHIGSFPSIRSVNHFYVCVLVEMSIMG